MRVLCVVLLACVGLAAASLAPPQLQGHTFAKSGSTLKIKCDSLLKQYPQEADANIQAAVDNFNPEFEIGAIRLSMTLVANNVVLPEIAKTAHNVGSAKLKSSGKVVYTTMEQLAHFLTKNYGRPSWEVFGKIPLEKLSAFKGILRYKVPNKPTAAPAPAATPAAAAPPAPAGAGKAAVAADPTCEVCVYGLSTTQSGTKPEAGVCGKAKALSDQAEAICKDLLVQMDKEKEFFGRMKNDGCEFRGNLVKPCPDHHVCNKVKNSAGKPFCPGAPDKNSLDLFDGVTGKLNGPKLNELLAGSRKVGVWTCDA